MYTVIKRILDIVIAVSVCLLLLPFFLLIVLLLRISGEGEVFYRQTRIGQFNSEFRIFKFATMVKNSLNIGTGAITLRNDPRVTPVGKYLRITKINELPQILNVMLGEMSIVGPRPLVMATFNAYPEHVKRQIYQSKPGITGVGSIIYRDEEKLISASGMEPGIYYEQNIAPHKGEVELWYNKHKSVWTDLKIIFITGWVIVFPKSNLIYKCFKGLPKREL
jgi:lipopolysaccharide/colanic/teichoic acid biosynthesis glycosyltransferase